MIRSLALIVIPLVVITIIFTNVPDDHPVKEVDWKPVLATARKEAPFEVLAPTNLPEGWRATRVNWVPQGRPYLNGEASPRNLWQIGFLSPMMSTSISIRATRGLKRWLISSRGRARPTATA